MKEYAEIHLKLDNEKYIDSANRILLVLGTSSFFAADVHVVSLVTMVFAALGGKQN